LARKERGLAVTGQASVPGATKDSETNTMGALPMRITKTYTALHLQPGILR
jgi:hypothetical protein